MVDDIDTLHSRVTRVMPMVSLSTSLWFTSVLPYLIGYPWMKSDPVPLPNDVFIVPEILGDVRTATCGRDDGVWSTEATSVMLALGDDGLAVRISSPGRGLSKVGLRWRIPIASGSLVMGDTWERGYGDFGWETMRPERALPWYWLASEPSGIVRAAGVRVRAGAMCSWQIDSEGFTLWLDVRSGRDPVLLGNRILDAATVVMLDSADTAYETHRRLCLLLCSDPLVDRGPIVGSNNWYYAYGENFDLDSVVRDAAMIATFSEGHEVRPFSVIDAGWSKQTTGAPGGPWRVGLDSFNDMAEVASRIRSEGARPGVWMRPLLTSEPGELARSERLDGEWPLDPSREDVLELVADDVERITGWGYDLLKYDFTTYDTLHGFAQRQDLGLSGVPWSFADRSLTTAEVLIRLYSTVKRAAGAAVVLGCNTVGHLAAGLVDVQRVGDDTSGRRWERTRRMGVNALAFRLAQNRALFTVDADCVASTTSTPWDKNRQFLDIVAKSGTALFLSIDPATRGPELDRDVRRAVQIALDGGSVGGVEPLDWLQNSAPEVWRVGDGTQRYRWNMPWGADADLLD